MLRLARKAALAAAFLAATVACDNGTSPSEPDVRTTASVERVELEGGFFGIVGDDGSRYDPVNLAQEFQQHGLRVYVEARILEDQVSVHQWGQIVEITLIRRE